MSTLRLPEILKSYSAPSSSSESQMSEQYDYSGLDDHIKRQDTIGALRDQKFAKLASGDVLGAQASGNQIRDLLAAVKANAPAATERNPNQIAAPLVRVASRSQSSSSKSGGGGFDGMPEPEAQRAAPAASAAPLPKVTKQYAKGATNVPALPPAPAPFSPDLPGATPTLPEFYQRGGVNAMRLPPPNAKPRPQAPLPEKDEEVADALDPFGPKPKSWLTANIR